MTHRISRMLALALLLILPLQGVASMLAPLYCHTGEAQAARTAETAHSDHGHAHHVGHGSHHGAPADNTDGAPGEYTGHLCCHSVFTAAPTMPVLALPLPVSRFTALSATPPPPVFAEGLRRPPRS